MLSEHKDIILYASFNGHKAKRVAIITNSNAFEDRIRLYNALDDGIVGIMQSNADNAIIANRWNF